MSRHGRPKKKTVAPKIAKALDLVALALMAKHVERTIDMSGFYDYWRGTRTDRENAVIDYFDTEVDRLKGSRWNKADHLE